MPANFYQVNNLTTTATSLTCRISYDAFHPIFSGHFPDQPVVPGVCTMDMIKDLLEATLDQPLILRSTGQVKFLRLILPDVTPTVNISWQESDNGYAVAAVLEAEGAAIFKMNATFERC